jgi:hypothetical protein
MEHVTWIKAAARPGPNANLPIARTLVDFKTPACHRSTHNIYFFKEVWNSFDVLPAWKYGCMIVGALHFSSKLP